MDRNAANDRQSFPVSGAQARELTAEELDLVSGGATGVVAPVEPPTGHTSGRRSQLP